MMTVKECEFTLDPMKELKYKIGQFDKNFQGNDVNAQIESAIEYLNRYGYKVIKN